jgi:hypothetical protein
MIQITNTNNQLRIVDSGRIEFYKFEEITNVAWNRSAENGYYVLVTFDSDYLLRIELSRIDNQPTWTNNLAGAQAAVIQISIWMNTAVAAITALLTAAVRTTNFLRPTGASSGTIAAGTFSMSFASVGTGNATVGGITLKPGETINFDAGALNNTLGAVVYSTTPTGELIIITLT